MSTALIPTASTNEIASAAGTMTEHDVGISV